jgi:putative spermidine/putrescine transport system permease protein
MGAACRSRSAELMEPRAVRVGLRAASTAVMLFLYLPLAVIVLQAFSASKIPGWPIGHYSTHWFRLAWNDLFARTAFENSVTVGLRASALALVLGSCVAFALSRFRFFGQNTVSLLFVLPIALPGIVTGLALLSTIDYLGITPSLWTVVAGHATFCIVVVFNNVVARLRRTSTSLEEASMDLGADGWQTFRHITLPSIATALVAGGLLAFALSFDEVVVTLFTAGSQQTLPLWIYNQFRLPNTAAEVNAVAVFVIALTAIPVYLAQRLMRDTGGITGR